MLKESFATYYTIYIYIPPVVHHPLEINASTHFLPNNSIKKETLMACLRCVLKVCDAAEEREVKGFVALP